MSVGYSLTSLPIFQTVKWAVYYCLVEAITKNGFIVWTMELVKKWTFQRYTKRLSSVFSTKIFSGYFQQLNREKNAFKNVELIQHVANVRCKLEIYEPYKLKKKSHLKMIIYPASRLPVSWRINAIDWICKNGNLKPHQMNTVLSTHEHKSCTVYISGLLCELIFFCLHKRQWTSHNSNRSIKNIQKRL